MISVSVDGHSGGEVVLLDLRMPAEREPQLPGGAGLAPTSTAHGPVSVMEHVY